MQFFALAKSAFAIALVDARADNIMHNISERFINFSKRGDNWTAFYRVSTNVKQPVAINNVSPVRPVDHRIGARFAIFCPTALVCL